MMIQKCLSERSLASLLKLISTLAILCLTSSSFAKAPKSDAWIQRARKVGQSETAAARNNALAALKKQKNLSAKLTKALDSANRPLALDAISALGMKSLVRELQKRASSDPDGFLILTLSSLLDAENKDSVLSTYKATLEGDISSVSAGAIVAMFEPLGRLGEELSKESLTKLSGHAYPEVRAGLLYYLRAMALSHNKRNHNDLLVKLLSANEFQVRLQAVSVIKELELQPGHSPVIPTSELEKRCQKEKPARIKDQCLAFVRKGQT